MSGCEAKVPALRFKGHPGSWERKRLGDEVSFSKGKGYSKSDISATGMPLFLYGRLYTDYQAEVDDVDTFTQLQKGSVLSNGGEVVVPGSGETPEDIARASAVLSRGIILGGDLNILTPKDFEKTYSPFLALSLSNGRTSLQIADRAQGKTIVHIHNSDLENIQVAFPSFPEQRRIGSFFRSLDALIAGREKALEKLEALKKSMLLKMFPQGDATVPEVRFKGFAGDWEKKRLGNFLEEREENNRDGIETEILSVMKDVGVIRYADKGNVGNRAKEDVTQYNIARKGDIVLNSMNVIIGSVGVAPCDGCISPAYYALRPMVNADASFWGYWFWRKESQCVISSLACGMMEIRRKISVEDLLSIVTPVPSLPEQQKIGAYFRSLDALLAARRDEIAKLKNLKKALLDRMFV